jgi:hypothetical protein
MRSPQANKANLDDEFSPDPTLGTVKDIPCKPTWNTANYLLFSSLADLKTAYFIDNVKLEQITKPK